MDSRMCSAQKCAFWQREAEPTTCKGPELERLLRTSAVSELDVPTTYHNFTQVRFLSLQVFVTPVLCECHNKAGVGTNVDISSIGTERSGSL